MLRLLLIIAFALAIIVVSMACGGGNDSTQDAPTVSETAIGVSNTATLSATPQAPTAATASPGNTPGPTGNDPPPFMQLPDECRVLIAAWEDFPSSQGWTWPGGRSDSCEKRLGLSLAATRAHYEGVGDSDYLFAKEFWAEDY